MWQINGSSLEVDGKVVLSLPYPVSESREIEGTVIMVLDVPPDITYPENVFGYVIARQQSWQLQAKSYYQKATSDVVVTGISPIRDPGHAILFTWAGVLLRVDLSTGKIVSTELSK